VCACMCVCCSLEDVVGPSVQRVWWCFGSFVVFCVDLPRGWSSPCVAALHDIWSLLLLLPPTLLLLLFYSPCFYLSLCVSLDVPTLAFCPQAWFFGGFGTCCRYGGGSYRMCCIEGDDTACVALYLWIKSQLFYNDLDQALAAMR